MSIEKVYLKYDSSITEEMFNDLVRLLKDNGYQESDHLGFTNNFATFKHNHYGYLRISPYPEEAMKYYVDNHAVGNSPISYKELIKKLSKDEFKVGDWVVLTKSDKNWVAKMDSYINKIVQITGFRGDNKEQTSIDFKERKNWGYSWVFKDGHFRKALPHEIPNSIDTCEYVKALSSTGLGSYTKDKVYKVKDRDDGLILTEADNFNSSTNGWFKSNFKPATKEEYEAQQSEIDKYIGKQFTYKGENTVFTINKLTDEEIRVTWDLNKDEDNWANYSKQRALELIKEGSWKIKEDSIDSVDPYRGTNKLSWMDGSVQWVDLTDPHSGVFTGSQDQGISPDKPIIVKREKKKKKLFSLI